MNLSDSSLGLFNVLLGQLALLRFMTLLEVYSADLCFFFFFDFRKYRNVSPYHIGIELQVCRVSHAECIACSHYAIIALSHSRDINLCYAFCEMVKSYVSGSRFVTLRDVRSNAR